MFNILELELHDSIVIRPILVLGEAEASSTAGSLLHFQVPSPASPLETSCPFPVSNIPLDQEVA